VGHAAADPLRRRRRERLQRDNEPHLSPDHRTLYFSSDRMLPVHFPRTPAQAQADLERINSWITATPMRGRYR